MERVKLSADLLEKLVNGRTIIAVCQNDQDDLRFDFDDGSRMEIRKDLFWAVIGPPGSSVQCSADDDPDPFWGHGD